MSERGIAARRIGNLKALAHEDRPQAVPEHVMVIDDKYSGVHKSLAPCSSPETRPDAPPGCEHSTLAIGYLVGDAQTSG
jgi:hypothetical protein